MTSNNQTERESLFQTPNPIELKEEAKKDPIQERYPDPDADVNDEHLDTEKSKSTESYFEEDDTRALSSSPIINANISAG